MESFGRWGAAAECEVRNLARARVARLGPGSALDASQARAAVLRRYRERLSVQLMRGNFEVVRASTFRMPDPELHAAPLEAALWLQCAGL